MIEKGVAIKDLINVNNHGLKLTLTTHQMQVISVTLVGK